MPLIKRIKENRDKGFSLTELIVVISIMIILIAMMLPHVIGYIKRASKLSAINTVRVMVNTMEVSMLEHSMEKSVVVNKLYKPEGSTEYIDAGYLTNYMLQRAQANVNYNKNADDYADFLIAQDILEAVKSGPGEQHPYLHFIRNSRPNNEIIKNVSQGGDLAIFVYAPAGGVLYAQVALGDTWLVTYEGNDYTAVEIKRDTRMVGTNKVKDNIK